MRLRADGWYRRPRGLTARVAPRMRGVAVATLAAALAASALLSPAAALASRLPTDEIAGVSLEISGLERAAPDITAASALLAGPDGRLLWARDIDRRRAVASITKVMTALVVLERSDLDDVVTISEAASRAPYAAGLHPGERYTVRQLLEYALVASSNDAAHALAEHVAGSVPAFATLMNDMAQESGLSDTHFVNPHGIDAEGHHSSAHDVVTMLETAMEDPEFRRIVALDAVELPEHEDRPKATLKSTDRLLGSYADLVGGKTGYTGDARYCFAASAQHEGVELAAVVLGSPTGAARFEDTRRLFDWGFEHLEIRTIATTTETVGAAPLSVDPTRLVPVRFAEESSTLVFDLDGAITRSASFDPDIGLPVFEGQPLGEVELVQGDRPLATLPVVASQDVASAGETVGAVPVSDYLDLAVDVRASGEPLQVPEFDPEAGIQREVELDDQVAAPVAEGDRVGTITYSQDGRLLVEVPAVAATDVEVPGAVARVGIWLARVWRGVLDQPIMATPEVFEVPPAVTPAAAGS